MPKRFVGDEIRYCKQLAGVSEGAFRMFVHLKTLADDFGRFRAEPNTLKADCFPEMPRVTLKDTLRRFDELIAAELVKIYTVSGIRYGYFPHFNLPSHQGPPRAAKSKFPEPLNTPIENKGDNICKQIKTDSLVFDSDVRISSSVSDFDKYIPPMTANSHKDFKPEDSWLKDFLLTQTLVEFREIERTALLDPEWWERTSIACHGISKPFIECEFAKIGNWLSSHKNRRPTKRFIQNWMERAGVPQ